MKALSAIPAVSGIAITEAWLHPSDEEDELLESDVILIADRLDPSDYLRLPLEWIAGIVVGEREDPNAVALARQLGVPALVGAGPVGELLDSGDLLILDAHLGKLIVDPDPTTLLRYERERGQERTD
ncbi:MAG TPA: hypothetical protein DEA08_02215 [Planctomycetes bacterium]|nr:hypothetical protein [Planctomycetota bacterium]